MQFFRASEAMLSRRYAKNIYGSHYFLCYVGTLISGLPETSPDASSGNAPVFKIRRDYLINRRNSYYSQSVFIWKFKMLILLTHWKTVMYKTVCRHNADVLRACVWVDVAQNVQLDSFNVQSRHWRQRLIAATTAALFAVASDNIFLQ